MPEAQPEEVVEVTLNPEDPTQVRFRLLLQELPEQLETEPINPLDPEAPLPPLPPPQNNTREARIGPLEIKLDLTPFIRVIDRLSDTFRPIMEKLAGSEVLEIVEDIASKKRTPVTDFEKSIARTIFGPTRFERINEDD